MVNFLLLMSIIFSLLSAPAIGRASHVIFLKNGGKIETPLFWIEDNRLFFFYAGGVVGIHKHSIKGINAKFSGGSFDQEVEEKEEKISEKEFSDNAGGKGTPPRSVDNDYHRKQLQEDLQKLQSESNEAWKEYTNILERKIVSKAERDEALKRVFEIDIKKQELTRKMQDKNQKLH